MTEIDYDALLADPRAETGKLPAGANGGGEDLRGSPEFEMLENEFRKIETAGPAAVDWKMVNRTTLDLLKSQKILVTHGRGFNWPDPDHLRIVTLPNVEILEDAITRFGEFLESYSQ